MTERCSYCGEKLGWFQSDHSACRVALPGFMKMIELAKKAALGSCNLQVGVLGIRVSHTCLDHLEEDMAHEAAEGRVPANKTREVLIHGWEQAVEDALEAGVLTEETELALRRYGERFQLAQGDLDQKGAYTRMIQAVVLRELSLGHVPERIETNQPLPFNFQKTEKVVWMFPRVEYYEERVRRHYAGGSLGLSLKMAKGLYLRPSIFRSWPVETTDRELLDTGLLAVTDKHLYFQGAHQEFRIEYSRIVAFHQYADGVGVTKDGERAHPQVFITGDGWFAYNLMSLAAQLG